MAGEVVLINPRHRRRRRKKARATHKRRRRRTRSNPIARLTRRRRRGHRRSHARRGRRRMHHNPRLPILGKVNLAAIGGGAVGFIGTKFATPWLLGMLPPQWSADPNTAPLVRIGAKAVVGVLGIPMILKFIPGMKKFAGPVAIGAGIAVAVDIFETWIGPKICMSDYEQGYITAYEPGQITGTDEAGVDGAYGGSTF